ncbi:MAG: hypothetical protein GXY08_12590 [Ruminococcus sp.]|nr:hypothetical protein [Ruminococcus sp.]
MAKKALAAFICTVTAALALSSCGKHLEVDDASSYVTSSASGEGSQAATEPEHLNNGEINIERFSDRSVPDIDKETSTVKNFTAPKEGDTVIIMKLKGYDGEIKIRLFPEYAEKGVENFVGLAEKGYYDGLIFHRVIRDFMIQGGDPTGTGTGGDSIWGGMFDGGADTNVIHAAGAVAYANSGSTATDRSQFYIVTGSQYPTEQFAEQDPEDVKKVYSTAGGAPWLDGGYTVFGQVYQGLDIVFSAQDVLTQKMVSDDPMNAEDRPVEELAIEYLKVGKYEGEELKWFIADYK